MASRDDLACAYCSSDDSKFLYETTSADGDHYTLRACLNCQAVFLSPRPTAEKLAAAYSSEYYGETERKFVGPIERVIDRFRSARARRVAAALPDRARVLDIGCGNGGFLEGIAELGFEAHGIELPGGSADRALLVDDINVYVGALEDGHFAGQHFDVITMWHVFEHLVEPRKTLELVADMLNPGGRLYLSLPNIDSWQARRFRGDWFHLDPPRHLFFLGPDPLTAIVENLGFQRESVSFFSLEQNPFGIVQSVLNQRLDERDMLYEALKGNQEVGKRNSRWTLAWQKALFVGSYPVVALLATIQSLRGQGATMELVFVKSQSEHV